MAGAETAQQSGQITVTTAGTAVQGDSVWSRTGFWICAHPDNTDNVWIGDDGTGDVTKDNGFPLPTTPIYRSITNLGLLWFDAEVNGEKICWSKV